MRFRKSQWEEHPAGPHLCLPARTRSGPHVLQGLRAGDNDMQFYAIQCSIFTDLKADTRPANTLFPAFAQWLVN